MYIVSSLSVASIIAVAAVGVLSKNYMDYLPTLFTDNALPIFGVTSVLVLFFAAMYTYNRDIDQLCSYKCQK